jgi:hypothetical protein
VLARGRLTDPELLGDEKAAHTVFDEIAVDLRREVARRRLEPVHDGEAPLVRQRLHDLRRDHVVSLPFDEVLRQSTEPEMSLSETTRSGHMRRRFERLVATWLPAIPLRHMRSMSR